MQTGRFINTIKNNALAYYQTKGCEKLLSKPNLRVLWNMKQSGASTFTDDYAIAYTAVKPEFDDLGRMILSNDTVIIKFDADDIPLILSLLNEKFQYFDKMQTYQKNNGHDLTNPLPQVEL